MPDPRVLESFSRQSMMTSLKARLIAAEPGRCVIDAPILPGFLQQHGAAHAAVAFALGDSAAGYAALAMMRADQEVMTVEMKINLLSPALGERLEAVGAVVRHGRRLSVVTAEVSSWQGQTRKTIAILQGSMIAVPQPALPGLDKAAAPK